MIAICFGIYLSFTMSSMLCVQGVRVLHNKDFESTLLSSNIRSILFEFCDLQYVHSIQYGTTLHFTEYWKRPEKQGLNRRPRAIILDNSWAKNANLWIMLNCNLFSITLSPNAALILLKNVTLYRITDHWWLDQTVNKLNVFLSRKFIACHLNPSVLWYTKKSRMRVLMGHQHSGRFIVLGHQYGAVTSCENALSVVRDSVGQHTVISHDWFFCFFFVMALPAESPKDFRGG